MEIEVFIHIARLEDFRKGYPVNAKIGFASQYDIKATLKLKDCVIHIPPGQNGLIVIRKKKLIDRLGLRKFFKLKTKQLP